MSNNKDLNKSKKDENENSKEEEKNINIIILKKNKENDEDKKMNDKFKYKYNIIIGNIKVEKNRKQRIINSYENAKKEYNNLIGEKNEEEIKNCEIFINDKHIDFTYYYTFK